MQNKKGDKVVSGGTIKAASLEIRNTKQGTPKLPMTGGAGVGILAAIGAAIVAAGAWFARRGAKN
ncbi:fimbrial assembly protein [Corynebacterium diphtheriae]|nr:fimbrial assembly protein [Corynebacterium diphtheriae]